WHGASWNFVVWGGLHGVYLSLHKLATGGRPPETEPAPRGAGGWLTFTAQALVTFHLVCLAWIFFRAPDFATAWAYLTGIFVNRFSAAGVPGPLAAVCFYGLLMLLLDYGCWRYQREFPLPEECPTPVRGLAYAGA